MDWTLAKKDENVGFALEPGPNPVMVYLIVECLYEISLSVRIIKLDLVQQVNCNAKRSSRVH